MKQLVFFFKFFTSLTLCTSALLFTNISFANATICTKVSVVEKTTSSLYTMTDKGKIYFSNNCIVVEDGNSVGAKGIIPLANIQKVLFSTVDVSDSGEEVVLSSFPTLSLFPNPVVDYFTISSDNDERFAYEIFNAQGQKVKQGNSDSNSKVDVSNLPQGEYFVSMKNGYVKFIKK